MTVRRAWTSTSQRLLQQLAFVNTSASGANFHRTATLRPGIVGRELYSIKAMQAANRFQNALKSSTGQSFGAWQMLPGSNLSRLISKCGFDWICVDTEHGNIDGKQCEVDI